MTPANAITVANDESLSELIRSAKGRLVVLTPAVSMHVAEAIAERWKVLGKDAVTVVLDVDPEVYRLGYGDIKALELLEPVAADLGVMVNRHKGIRVGMVIADDRTLVYSPTPQLIEAGPRSPDAPNAIMLGAPPAQVERELGAGPQGVKERRIGEDKATKAEIQAVSQDLKQNPPLKFDVARTVSVFSSKFEFVEFELLGTFIDRKTVPIPKHLSGIADEKTRDQFRQSFTILPANHKLSGEHLQHDKKLITKKYLRPVKDFGAVLLRAQKEAFLKDVEALRKAVEEFGQKVREELQAEMDKQRTSLGKALLPLVKRRPPKDWCRSDGTKPDAATLEQFLADDLRRAFGSADELVKGMQVRVVIKGITWEMLNDKDFVEAAREVLPEYKKLYDEFDAAKAKQTTKDSGGAQ